MTLGLDADLPGVRETGHADLGWALTTVLRAYLRAANHVLEDLPGGSRALRLLASVAYDDLPSQLAVAQRVGLDRTVVTYLLDDLADAGLIERQPDPADRRARRPVITPAGADRLADFERRLHSIEGHILGSLDDGDRTQFRILLDRLARQLPSTDSTTCRHVAALADGVSCLESPPGVRPI
ncbi:MAG TPA: MarR family winged helix-turn-helix transcriptional regulator [Candidatus Nitrosotalea sp.]|nr:MarR family winged helix-turn-helix transcriptional regulator [Candidatus Nitrosotalea sp.]